VTVNFYKFPKADIGEGREEPRAAVRVAKNGGSLSAVTAEQAWTGQIEWRYDVRAFLSV
jgi:hypothetical protein